jgi:hypothetical protein
MLKSVGQLYKDRLDKNVTKRSTDPYKVDIHLEGNEEGVKRILKLIDLLHYNGNIGHSGQWWISFDGDGSDKVDMVTKEDVDAIKTDGVGEVSYSDMQHASSKKE